MTGAPPSAIARAGPDDLPAVRDISAAAYVPAYTAAIGAVPKPASEDYAPRIARGEVWLLREGGEPVGVLVLEECGDALLVYSVAVRPDRQGRGSATALLDFAAGRAAERGLPEVRLYTNARMARNLALYARCGFAETGRRPHPSRPGEVLVDLSRPAARR